MQWLNVERIERGNFRRNTDRMFRDLFRHSDAITDLKFRENLKAGGNLNFLFYCIGSVGRSEAVKLYRFIIRS